MKNEQAIEKLKRGVDFLSMIDDAEAKELVECYILAIKALQREIPKNPVVNFVGDSDGSRRLNKWWAEDCPKESEGDCMKNEEAIKWLKDIHHRFNPTGEKLENEGGDVHLQALDMAIEALKQVTGKLRNPDDSLLTEDAEACKEQKSKLDLISRQDAINAIENTDVKITAGEWDELTNAIESLPSAEPRELGVLCALADRTCPFQGKEFAWCLTCPHISEEDRELVKKVVAEPKTEEWIYVDNESVSELWSCSGCGQWSFGRTNYCPNCGADMRGEEE